MNKDQAIGAVILVGSMIGLLVYGWLIYAFPMVILQITAFLAAAVVLVVLAWIGWTMATTPPPALLESEPPAAASTSTAPEEKPAQTTEGNQPKTRRV